MLHCVNNLVSGEGGMTPPIKDTPLSSALNKVLKTYKYYKMIIYVSIVNKYF